MKIQWDIFKLGFRHDSSKSGFTTLSGMLKFKIAPAIPILHVIMGSPLSQELEV